MIYSISINLVIQIAMLLAIFARMSYGVSGTLYKFFSPASFLILFYTLFFIVEQLMLITANIFPFGTDLLSGASYEQRVVRTQYVLILFLFGIFVASLSGLIPSTRVEPRKLNRMLVQMRDKHISMILWAMFLVGLAAILYLGIKFIQIGGFRSQLVKTIDGKIFTAIGFMANFAYMVILLKFLLSRKIFQAVLLTLVFGGAVLLTGSRGRFLWPVILAACIYISTYRKLPVLALAVSGAAGIILLAIMDPLRKAITNPDYAFTLLGSFESFLNSRNFDGFANLMLIVYGFQVPEPSVFLTGSRDAFMMQFYPQVLLSGVGFGSTYPGYLYMAGGMFGVFVGGLIFGIIFMILNRVLRKTNSIWVVFSYMVLMPWVAAVGGDFVESIDKMVIAIFPGFLLYFIQQKFISRSGGITLRP